MNVVVQIESSILFKNDNRETRQSSSPDYF